MADGHGAYKEVSVSQTNRKEQGMKLNWVVEWRCNDIEARLLIDAVIGWTAFFAGMFFDPIAQHFQFQHEVTFGNGQMLWCAFWGIYNIWTSYQLRKWKE